MPFCGELVRMMTLILASQSPRRAELLQKAGFAFQVHSVQISEIPNENMSLEEQIQDLARQKAEALVQSGKLPKLPRILLLSADTLVILDGEVLGKPKDLEQSEEFLRRLSGNTHSVVTGICLWDLEADRRKLAFDRAFVTFRILNDQQIRSYVDSRDGMDKAGAYGIQTLDRNFIAKIDGAIDNVMGLPVTLVEKLLKENNWHVDRH